jgi:hypothetical protein
MGLSGIPSLDSKFSGSTPAYAFQAVLLKDVVDGKYYQFVCSGGAIVASIVIS